MSDDASARFEQVKQKFRDFERKVRFDDVSREVNEVMNSIRNLPEEVKKIRSRGYSFRSFLEQKVDVLEKHWKDIQYNVQRALDSERNSLTEEYQDAEKKVEAAERVADSPEKLGGRLQMVESAVESLENKIEAATDRIRTMFEELQQDVNTTAGQIREINWFCDKKDEATFPFLAGEALFLAATAEWTDGKDTPEGVLFLTDQRLIFEQNETTGKRLGLFGGKKEHEVEWEIPLHQIEKVVPENKGFFGGKDMLNFTLGSGAPFAKLTVEVKGGVDCKFWAKQIERMMRGETTDERAIPPDPEMLENIRSAPTTCHVCGGTLPKLVAGQNQINCPFCGAVIRI